jgi:glutamate-1-semialdehyde 2,1-aminomutase/spore coat polysaccharide biosynthesis protein SpsF
MNDQPNLDLTRSLALHARAKARIPGGAQTTSKRPGQFAFGGYPIYADHGAGGWIVDVDGNRYIDFVQALGPVILGYCHPAVDAAIAAQLQRGILYGLNSPLEVECAELLAEVIPCAEMVRFFKGGGEATAAAARTVRGYTGRELILNCGYRGWPDVWAVRDPAVPGGLRESVESFPEFDLAALESRFALHPGEVAAVFLDVQRTAPPPGYLAAVKELCHTHGALLVFDEIVTGFRLALGGLQEWAGVTPDLACFAKAMANGMPLACVAGRADVMATMQERLITLTYGGESLSLAAAIACIQTLRAEQVPERLWELGRQLRAGLNQAAEQYGIPFVCGGLDPMTTMTFTDAPAAAGAGVSYQADPGRSRPTDAGQALLWEYFLQEMAVRGVLLRRGGLNFVTNSHTAADVAQVIAAAGEVFAQLRTLWDVAALQEAVQRRKQSALPSMAAGS